MKKIIKIVEEVHTKLKIYAAETRAKTLSEAIDNLLGK